MPRTAMNCNQNCNHGHPPAQARAPAQLVPMGEAPTPLAIRRRTAMFEPNASPEQPADRGQCTSTTANRTLAAHRRYGCRRVRRAQQVRQPGPAGGGGAVADPACRLLTEPSQTRYHLSRRAVPARTSPPGSRNSLPRRTLPLSGTAGRRGTCLRRPRSRLHAMRVLIY
jgi:hypothetical protein